MTATWQMVGVHNIRSAPQQAELEGWSFELKAKTALGIDRPEGAPYRMEAAPTWRTNGLTWRPEGGACEPPRRAATTGADGTPLIAGRVVVSVESGSAEGEAPAHPYLARQMSDFRFWQTLEVRALGCSRRSHPQPTHVSPPR